MFILKRYLLADILKPTLVSLVVMLCLVWLLQSLRFLDFIINKGVELSTFLGLTLMLIPLLLTIIVPLATFAGVAYAYKRLQDENEMTSLFASGRSRWWVARPAVGVGLAATVVGYAIYLWVLPASTTAFKDLQYNIRTQEGHLLLEEGTFNVLGKNLMVYLGKREALMTDSQSRDVGMNRPVILQNLLVHDTSDPLAPVTWLARTGEVRLGNDGSPRIVLKQGIRQEVTPDQVNMLEFAEHELDIRQRLNTSALQPRMRESEEYLWPELWQKAQENNAPGRKLMAEAMKRLTAPLTPLPLVLMAAVILIRPAGRQRKTMQWVAGASVLAILYQAALMGLQGAAEEGARLALFGQWALPLLVTAGAGLLLREPSQPQRKIKGLKA